MNYNYTVINKETEEQVGGDFITSHAAQVYADRLNKNMKSTLYIVVKS